MESPKDKEIFDHISEALADYDQTIETMMLNGLNRAVEAGRISEVEKQELLNTYIDARLREIAGIEPTAES